MGVTTRLAARGGKQVTNPVLGSTILQALCGLR